MSAKLTSAPVFYTIAQIKFNPIQQMGDYVQKTLQDSLRRRGYPDYRTDNLISFALNLNNPKAEMTQQQKIRWSFSNTNRTEGYLLFTDALIFHTTTYTIFKDFSSKLIDGLELLHEIVDLSYIENIGLRYLNAITENKNNKIEKYLNPSLFGFSSLLGGSLTKNFIETLTTIEDGSLVARIMMLYDQLALPPDLQPLQLELPHKFSNLNGKVAVLDMDYFKSQRLNFDINPIELQLLQSNKILSKAFHASVTEDALKDWK